MQGYAKSLISILQTGMTDNSTARANILFMKLKACEMRNEAESNVQTALLLSEIKTKPTSRLSLMHAIGSELFGV